MHSTNNRLSGIYQMTVLLGYIDLLSGAIHAGLPLASTTYAQARLCMCFGVIVVYVHACDINESVIIAVINSK